MALYIVSREGAEEGEKPRIIEARTKAQAIGAVAKGMFEAEPLSSKEAHSWGVQGVAIEDATEIE